MAKLFANSGYPNERRILQHLIWVCTVCQLPFYGSSDYNGLKWETSSTECPWKRQDSNLVLWIHDWHSWHSWISVVYSIVLYLNMYVCVTCCRYNRAPDRTFFFLFFFTKTIVIFFVFLHENMLWVIIRSTSLRHFYWVPTTYNLMEK